MPAKKAPKRAPGGKPKRALMGNLDEKIFFVIKFWLMSAFQGAALILIVFFIGAVDALGLLLIGIFLFLAALIISRQFNKSISALALWITRKLNDYPKVKGLIAKGI